tara:strand:+ start:119 stop:328 length:210 start_codon:yes stop_codon:yes gene_type:complete
MKELEFNIEHYPQTSEYNSDYWQIHVPYDIYDSADEIDSGLFRALNLYKDELIQLHKLISIEIQKLEKE